MKNAYTLILCTLVVIIVFINNQTVNMAKSASSKIAASIPSTYSNSYSVSGFKNTVAGEYNIAIGKGAKANNISNYSGPFWGELDSANSLKKKP